MFSRKVPRPLHPGDWVIFSAPKHGVHPGPRAKDIRPERSGEGYLYVVDKFWVVSAANDTQVVLKTRRGKVHVVDRDDPHLRLASWWERLIGRRRFPRPDAPAAQGSLPA
jgi:hypothetical protein